MLAPGISDNKIINEQVILMCNFVMCNLMFDLLMFDYPIKSLINLGM